MFYHHHQQRTRARAHTHTHTHTHTCKHTDAALPASLLRVRGGGGPHPPFWIHSRLAHDPSEQLPTAVSP